MLHKSLIFILPLIILSCSDNESKPQHVNSNDTKEETPQLTDKDEKFMWREDRYNKESDYTYSKIIINEKLCKSLSNPERAALGYVATFIGNECDWDGDYTENRSNLKCKILTALNLGYQCSEQHLGFLRKWFKNDTVCLRTLESCPTTPSGATIQDTFDEITLTVKGDKISIYYEASGINVRDGDSWHWIVTSLFQVEKDNIKLIKKDASEAIHEKVDFS